MVDEVIKLTESSSAQTLPMDVIPTSIMKSNKEKLEVMIVNMANRSFSAARFPQSMKTGLVTSLLKKPGLDSTNFKNFRSFTNLITILKIIERLVLHSLRPHLVLHSSAS